jgi:hypothetical protein
MAKDGSSWWGWISRRIIMLLPARARTFLVRRDTASNAPPDHSAPVLSAPGPLSLSSRQQREIRFYHQGQPYDEFTNYAPYDVIFQGKRYPTCEHLYQAFKVGSVSLIIGVCSLEFAHCTCSSWMITQISQSVSELAAMSQIKPLILHTSTNPRSGMIGRRSVSTRCILSLFSRGQC